MTYVDEKFDIPQPHPLPMPEYGGYFAPLTEYLPDSSQPISGFHRYHFRTLSCIYTYLFHKIRYFNILYCFHILDVILP